MVFISDFFITVPLEIIFFYFLYRSFKYTAKDIYLTIMNLSFFLVDILVLITIIISDLSLSVNEEAWLLGLFTGLSYLILPWFFYWFIANFKNYQKNSKELIFSKFQLFSLIALIIVGLLPILFPDLITLAPQPNDYSILNWNYGWQIEVAEFLLWLGFAVICINKRFDTNKLQIEPNISKLLSRIFVSAIIIFSTPVFFVLSTGFILLSLFLYVVGYLIIYTGLQGLPVVQKN